MFLRNLITTSTENYSEQLDRLKTEIENADAIVIGAGAGMSAAAGFSYSGERFERYFRDFAEKYHFKGAFDGMMRRWDNREEFWGYLATFLHTTQTAEIREPYRDLDSLLKGKDFFVIIIWIG